MNDRLRMHTLLHHEFGDEIKMSHITHRLGNYDVLYFSWAPQAGTPNWSYPYVDIVYWEENSTHIWKATTNDLSYTDCAIAQTEIFPTVWRPFGQIWLPVSFS